MEKCQLELVERRLEFTRTGLRKRLTYSDGTERVITFTVPAPERVKLPTIEESRRAGEVLFDVDQYRTR